jgi:hypothetical protein
LRGVEFGYAVAAHDLFLDQLARERGLGGGSSQHISFKRRHYGIGHFEFFKCIEPYFFQTVALLYHAFIIDLRRFVAENRQVLILVFKKIIFQKRLIIGIFARESHIRILSDVDRQVVAGLQEQHPGLVHAAAAVL